MAAGLRGEHTTVAVVRDATTMLKQRAFVTLAAAAAAAATAAAASAAAVDPRAFNHSVRMCTAFRRIGNFFTVSRNTSTRVWIGGVAALLPPAKSTCHSCYRICQTHSCLAQPGAVQIILHNYVENRKALCSLTHFAHVFRQLCGRWWTMRRKWIR